jgi:hypothetical protein
MPIIKILLQKLVQGLKIECALSINIAKEIKLVLLRLRGFILLIILVMVKAIQAIVSISPKELKKKWKREVRMKNKNFLLNANKNYKINNKIIPK